MISYHNPSYFDHSSTLLRRSSVVIVFPSSESLSPSRTCAMKSISYIMYSTEESSGILSKRIYPDGPNFGIRKKLYIPLLLHNSEIFNCLLGLSKFINHSLASFPYFIISIYCFVMLTNSALYINATESDG